MPNTVVVLLNVQTSKFKSSSLSLPIQNKMLLIKKEKIYHSFVANILTDHIYIEENIIWTAEATACIYDMSLSYIYIAENRFFFFIFFILLFEKNSNSTLFSKIRRSVIAVLAHKYKN